MYIIKIDFEERLSRFLKENDDKVSYSEVLDPNYATVYSSKKKAKEVIDKMYMKKYAKIKNYKIEIDNFKKQSEEGLIIRNSISFLKDDLREKYDRNTHTADDVYNYWLKYRKADEWEADSDCFLTWPDLYQVFKCLFKAQAFIDDNYKKYITFSLAVRKSLDFDSFKTEFYKALPDVTYLNGDYKEFLIFDYYLSERGDSVVLLYKSPNDIKIKGRYVPEKRYTSLKKAFEYLQTYRYYE